jgi:hypothetical protein
MTTLRGMERLVKNVCIFIGRMRELWNASSYSWKICHDKHLRLSGNLWRCPIYDGAQFMTVPNLLWYPIYDGTQFWAGTRWRGRSRVRFPMLSLEYFIDIILPIALWLWGRLSLLQNWLPGIFSGGKGGRCLGLTNLPSSSADCLEIWESQPPGTLWVCPACNGTVLPYCPVWGMTQ